MQVDHYINIILIRLDGAEQLYMAAHSLQEVNTAGLISPNHALNFLARQTPLRLPSHTMTIKVGGIAYCATFPLIVV
jgi:hypothetical protein